MDSSGSYREKVFNGLEKMPLNKVFDVPDGSFDFIVEWMSAREWGGGIMFKDGLKRFYKVDFS